MTKTDLQQHDGAIVYTFRGQIERGARYDWTEGYSATTTDGGVLYPWLTKRECQKQARDTFKGKAVFEQ